MKQLNIYFFLTWTIGLVACDNTEDLVQQRNDAPVIQILINDEPEGTFFEDSVKSSGLAGQFPFDFEVEINDENLNLSEVFINSALNSPFFLIQFDSILIDLRLVGVDEANNRVKLTAILFEPGIQEIRFTALDRLGRASEASLFLTVFENLTPVVRFQVSPYESSRFIRQIDLSSSFDQDSHFGGSIVSYHYVIDGREFAISQPLLLHPFPRPGSFPISVFVRDNNKAISTVQQFIISIE